MHVDVDSLVAIARFLDGAELLRLYVIGNATLSQKVGWSIRVFSTGVLKRFSNTLPILNIFSGLTQLTLRLKTTHYTLPINNARQLFEALPATLVLLNLSFAQSLQLVLNDSVPLNQKLPNLTSLSLAGALLPHENLNLRHLPDYLLNLCLNNYYGDVGRKMSSECLEQLPPHLEHLNIAHILVDIPLSDYRSFYQSLPSGLISLCLTVNMTNPSPDVFDTFCLPQLEKLWLSIEYESIHDIALPISRLSHALKYLSIWCVHLNVYFDAPLPIGLKSFDCPYWTCHQFDVTQHVYNNSQLEHFGGSSMGNFRDKQFIQLLKKCASSIKHLGVHRQRSFALMKEVAACLPKQLEDFAYDYLLDQSSNIDATDPIELFMALNALCGLKTLQVSFKDAQNLPLLCIPTLTSLNMTYVFADNTPLSTDQLLNCLSSVPLLNRLTLSSYAMDSLDVFFARAAQALPSLTRLEVNIGFELSCQAFECDNDQDDCQCSRNVVPMPNLRHLFINWIINTDAPSSKFDHTTKMWLQFAPNLYTLSVNANALWDIDEKYNASWMARLPGSLKMLYLSIPPTMIEAFPTRFHHLPPTLEVLNIVTKNQSNDCLPNKAFLNEALLHLPPTLVSLSFPALSDAVFDHLPKGIRSINSDSNDASAISNYFEKYFGPYGRMYGKKSIKPWFRDMWRP